MVDLVKSCQELLYESKSDDFPKFRYPIDLSRLIHLDNKEIEKWKERYNSEEEHYYHCINK